MEEGCAPWQEKRSVDCTGEKHGPTRQKKQSPSGSHALHSSHASQQTEEEPTACAPSPWNTSTNQNTFIVTTAVDEHYIVRTSNIKGDSKNPQNLVSCQCQPRNSADFLGGLTTRHDKNLLDLSEIGNRLG